uniref:Putative secreted protein n=1 Tax=Anopheles darlingi TaxID=43151 RepID=A0A2M4D0E7_ANODA
MHFSPFRLAFDTLPILVSLSLSLPVLRSLSLFLFPSLSSSLSLSFSESWRIEVCGECKKHESLALPGYIIFTKS